MTASCETPGAVQIDREIDEPIGKPLSGEVRIPDSEVGRLERKLKIAKSMQDILLKNKAFVLLVVCLILLCGIYITDTVLLNKQMLNSDLMNGLFELLKFFASTLVGFIFSEKVSK